MLLPPENLLLDINTHLNKPLKHLTSFHMLIWLGKDYRMFIHRPMEDTVNVSWEIELNFKQLYFQPYSITFFKWAKFFKTTETNELTQETKFPFPWQMKLLLQTCVTRGFDDKLVKSLIKVPAKPNYVTSSTSHFFHGGHCKLFKCSISQQNRIHARAET